MTSFTFLEIALKATAEGYPVFPLKAGEKVPLYKGSFYHATRNEEQIMLWWQDNPEANIGVPTGELGGISVIDVDGDAGIESFHDAFGDSLPSTRMHGTPRGGFHYIYKYDPLFQQSQSGNLYKVDVRNDGGYVVWEGSRVNGRRYERVTQYPVVSVGVVPEEFRKQTKTTKEVTPAPVGDWFADAIGGVEKGRRDIMSVKVWGRLAHAGLSKEAILPLLQAYADNCNPRWIPEENGGRTLAERVDYWTAKYPNPSEVLPIVDEDTGEIISPLQQAYQRLGFIAPGFWIDEPEKEDEWLVEGLIPASALTMVTAFPKAGKSVFTRHLAFAVAKGEPFLDREVTQGKVMYMAIEEHDQKVKSSFRKLGLTKDMPLLLRFDKPQKDADRDLRLIVEAEKPALVVIDTVARMPKANFEMNDYLRNSEWLLPYMYMAHEEGVAVVVNYHSSRSGRKLQGVDSIASPIGSVGILATPDQIIAITQESDNTRTLASVGRYDPVPPTLLGFDRETERISALAEKADIQNQQLRATIVESLDAEDWIGQTEFLKSCTGKTEDKLMAVNELVEDGVIERRGQGVSGSRKEIRLRVLFPVLPIGAEQRIETDRLNL